MVRNTTHFAGSVCSRWLLPLLAAVLLLQAVGLHAAPERVAWQRVPIAVELGVGIEQLVHFPEAVKVGVPVSVEGVLRVQSIAGTLYLLANQPFASTRLIVRGTEHGQVYLLDVSAAQEVSQHGPLAIYLPDAADVSGSEAITDSPRYGYVALTRFAAQQLYAPARLLQALPGVVRVPVSREPVALLRGASVEAIPLIAWRAGDLHVTAVRLTNTLKRPLTLDPRELHGQWLAATFQHNRLLGAGDEADRTVVYLVSHRPFAASLQ